jgi:hypothetical protein
MSPPLSGGADTGRLIGRVYQERAVLPPALAFISCSIAALGGNRFL